MARKSTLKPPFNQRCMMRIRPSGVPPCTLVAYNKDCPESRSRREHDLDTHSTDTAVLGLPGKKVQQRTQWLPNETKTHPEDAVTDCLAMRAAHLLQRRRKSDERQLEYHAEESDACAQSARVHTLIHIKVYASGERDLPIKLWVGIPTNISCKTADNVKTIQLAASGLQPRPTSGEYTWRFMNK